MSGMCRDAAWLASACEGQLVGLEGTELVSAPVVIDSRKVSDTAVLWPLWVKT